MFNWIKRLFRYNKYKSKLYTINQNGLQVWDEEIQMWIDAKYEDIKVGDRVV